MAILAHLRTLNVSRFRLSHKHHFFLAVRVATMYPRSVPTDRSTVGPTIRRTERPVVEYWDGGVRRKDNCDEEVREVHACGDTR